VYVEVYVAARTQLRFDATAVVGVAVEKIHDDARLEEITNLTWRGEGESEADAHVIHQTAPQHSVEGAMVPHAVTRSDVKRLWSAAMKAGVGFKKFHPDAEEMQLRFGFNLTANGDPRYLGLRDINLPPKPVSYTLIDASGKKHVETAKELHVPLPSGSMYVMTVRAARRPRPPAVP
jgi:hypothetical protein